jgi:hypothetical protein
MRANVVALSSGRAFSIDKHQYKKSIGAPAELLSIENRSVHAVNALLRKPKKPLKDREIKLLLQRVKDQYYSKGEVIIEENVETEAAVYFVRQGKVYTQKGRNVLMLTPGTPFGEELFQSAKSQQRVVGTSPCKAWAVTDCVCGVLSAREYYDVFGDKIYEEADPDSEGPSKKTSKTKKRAERRLSDAKPKKKLRTDIELKNLDRRVCLGEGNFGQVWLCVDKTAKKQQPYVLKIQSKAHLIEQGEVQVCLREKNLLAQVEHPLIVNLVSTFQDESFVFMLLDFVQGGELFSVMNPEEGRTKLPEEQARFYAFGIANALAYLHDMKYVYRDLKPENCLIDATGYPKLIDFGFAKKVTEKTFTLCGTPGYLAPEVVSNRGHNWAADHWSLGILIYEMLSDSSPFFEEEIEQMELFRSIVEDDFLPLKGISNAARELIDQLLEKDPTNRLGSLAHGERAILQHGWFQGLSPTKMRQRDLKAPWVPSTDDPFDTSNFDDWSDLEDTMLHSGRKLDHKEAAMFENF